MMIPIRFRLVLMSFLAVFICYIDRVNISVAIIPMQEQFGWSEAQTGIIFSIFYIGYVLTMILGGILADKYGGKTVLGVGVLLWSIFTMLTPFFAYNGFLALLFIRVLIGLGEGITFPSWHSLYARWIPFNERTRSIAITNSGISAGTIFGYVATALIIASYSWEWVFYSFGMLGLIWFIFWHKNFTSDPQDHKHISSKELELIKSEAPADSTASKLPLRKLLTNLPFIAITVATFCNNWALFTFISYLPKYVNSPISTGGLGIELDSAIFIIMILIPSIVSVLALISGGYLADSLIKKGLQVLRVRKTVNTIGFLGGATCLSPKYTGSIVGFAGGIGMIAAIISPFVAGLILELTGSWFLIFNISTFVLVFGGLFYLFFADTKIQFE
ncbi:MAG: MFS transporter [Proteobacteria bacterium]|nr:MFS transporter [Pseudomonadota bacterium]